MMAERTLEELELIYRFFDEHPEATLYRHKAEQGSEFIVQIDVLPEPDDFGLFGNHPITIQCNGKTIGEAIKAWYELEAERNSEKALKDGREND